MKSLGEKLKEVRVASGYQQKDVEELTGINRKSISSYETNRAEPDIENLAKLCRVYKTSADYFIDVDEEYDRITAREKKQTLDIRALDDHGQSIIDAVLSLEKQRMEEIRNSQTSMPFYDIQVNAVEHPTEMMKMDFYHGGVAAGSGQVLIEEEKSSAVFPKAIKQVDADFTIKVCGDSMEPAIHDGDLVLIRKQTTIEPGQVGVFAVDGFSYLKEYNSESGKMWLESYNREYEDIIIEDHNEFRVIGIMVDNIDAGSWEEEV